MGARARVAGARRSRSGPDAGRRTRHMNNWSAEAWRRVVESSPEGIVICDAAARDCPVLFVNAAFADMCGFPAAALLGTNLRMLQGTDRDQEARTRLREALERGEPARVLVRNYRPDGTLFWNEMVVQPVRSPAGQLTHFIGYHRDASERLKAAERMPAGLPTWLREDRLTGLHSRAYFEELLQRDWVLARRVRDLLMHHPTAGAGRYVTMSAGIASLVPPRALPLEGLLKACRTALKRAKKNGKDGIVNAEAGDFH